MRSKDYGYVLIMSTFLSLFGIAIGLVRRDPGRLRETPPGRDLFLLGVATFRLSRLLSHDRVTSVLREPFVERGRGEEQIEGTKEEPKGTGMRRALGELVNCAWCTSMWAGLFNVSLLALFPRTGRLFLLTLMASGLSEILDPVFPLLNYLSGYVQKLQKRLEQEEAQPRYLRT